LRDGAGFKQLDNKPCHQGSDPAVTLSPGHRQLFDTTVAVFELWNTGFDDSTAWKPYREMLAFQPTLAYNGS
jgi:hypothetical protein